MLLSRRKRKERKDLEIYLNFRPLTQVISLKYLGIIIDSKLTFREYINYITEKCSKLIFALSRSTKINWGLSYNALKTIHTGAILPLFLYGAPIWVNALNKACYRTKLNRVQRLINIRIAKSYRTVSNEALCMITGLTPIDIKIEETSRLFQITKGNIKEKVQFDHDTRTKHWLHRAISFSILEDCKEDDSTIQIYTDGSKNEQGVGAGTAIFITGKHTSSLQYRLNFRCTNNLSEQAAILKSLEYLQTTNMAAKMVTVYTDSQTTLDSIKNARIHTSLIDKIRLQTRKLEQADWNVRFCWVKAHVGTLGNEPADRLAKEAATNADIAICYNKIPKSVVLRELEKTSVEKWQSIWNCSTKGNATEEYFPIVTERLNMKISTNQHLTTMLKGHDNKKSYLNRFKIITSSVCPCGKNDQTTDHLLYECELLKTQRNGLLIAASKSGDWPTSKKALISKYYKAFKIFVNSIPFDNLG